MKVHFTSNGKANGMGTLRAVFDFFLPFTKRTPFEDYIRCEATALDTGGRVQRDFYTFRAIFWHYFRVLVWNPLVTGVNTLGIPESRFARAGGIALDTSAITTGAADTGKTTAFTVTGTNPLLFVTTWTNIDGTDRNDTATYAAASMTAQGTFNKAGTGGFGKVWYKLGPATGANNVITHYTSSTYNRTLIASYTGVLQTGFPDASTTNTANASSIATVVTTIAANCWAFLAVSEGIGTTLSAGTGTTLRQSSTDSNAIGDSNGALSAGSNSMTVNSSGTGQFATRMISFAPNIFTQACTDSLSVTDTLVKQAGKLLSESSSIVDAILRTIQRVFTESAPITDTHTGARTLPYVASESAPVNDSLVKQTSRPLTESVSITDTMLRVTARLFTEAVTIADAILRMAGKMLTDAVATVDATVRTVARSLTETPTVTDSVTRVTGRSFTDSLSITDLVTKVVVHVRSFVETFTITDHIRRFLNGLDARYSRKFPSNPGSYSSKYDKKGPTYEKKYPDP